MTMFLMGKNRKQTTAATKIINKNCLNGPITEGLHFSAFKCIIRKQKLRTSTTVPISYTKWINIVELYHSMRKICVTDVVYSFIKLKRSMIKNT